MTTGCTEPTAAEIAEFRLLYPQTPGDRARVRALRARTERDGKALIAAIRAEQRDAEAREWCRDLAWQAIRHQRRTRARVAAAADRMGVAR